MRFGLHLGTRGVAGTPDGLAALAAHAEACGFAYVGISDHLVIADSVDSVYPYTDDGVWFAQDSGFCLDQLSVLSFLAGQTSRIRLLTSVMVVPYRDAVLAAKMLATADILSKGRITVGVGAGWMAEEMRLLHSPPYASRGQVTREYIEAFKALWTHAAPNYQGEFANFSALRFEPKPVQQPHPPIWGGGEAKPARRRAALHADAWYPVSNNPKAPLDTPESYAKGLEDVRRMADTAGRDPACIEAALLGLGYQLRGQAQEPARRVFSGSASAIVDDIGAFSRAGLDTLVIGFESNELAQSLDSLSAFADEIMPAFALSD